MLLDKVRAVAAVLVRVLDIADCQQFEAVEQSSGWEGSHSEACHTPIDPAEELAPEHTHTTALRPSLARKPKLRRLGWPERYTPGATSAKLMGGTRTGGGASAVTLLGCSAGGRVVIVIEEDE